MKCKTLQDNLQKTKFQFPRGWILWVSLTNQGVRPIQWKCTQMQVYTFYNMDFQPLARESMRAASMSLKRLHNLFMNSISLTGYRESNSHFPSSRILHDNCTNLPSFAAKFSHGFTANRTAPLNEKRLLMKTGSKTQVFHKINGNDTQFVQDFQINWHKNQRWTNKVRLLDHFGRSGSLSVRIEILWLACTFPTTMHH